jgi:predicted AlkP superfamily pyrophosphatase or phosphodiesterase
MNTKSKLYRTLQTAHAEDPAQVAASPTFEKPRLVLQITVDQLRGDLPTRYLDRLGKGGLRYLLEQGIHYNNAHHGHANTETIVGHVTLATGAHPAAHGMIGNIWYDRTTGITTYNIEDPDYHLLTKGADVDADTEIDPTQKAASSDGRSPSGVDGRSYRQGLLVLKGNEPVRDQ